MEPFMVIPTIPYIPHDKSSGGLWQEGIQINKTGLLIYNIKNGLWA